MDEQINGMVDTINQLTKENEELKLRLARVMPSVLWDIAKEIVKKQQYCYGQIPNTEAFDWEDVEEDWFDWINEKLTGEES